MIGWLLALRERERAVLTKLILALLIHIHHNRNSVIWRIVIITIRTVSITIEWEMSRQVYIEKLTTNSENLISASYDHHPIPVNVRRLYPLQSHKNIIKQDTWPHEKNKEKYDFNLKNVEKKNELVLNLYFDFGINCFSSTKSDRKSHFSDVSISLGFGKEDWNEKNKSVKDLSGRFVFSLIT